MYYIRMSDKQNKLWFKRRRYGWGWTPATKQGWAVVLIFVIVVVFSAILLLPTDASGPTTQRLVIFFLIVMSAVLFLFGISYAKGPLPRWRWGEKDDDDPKI